jgi:hypothetical protein
LSTRVPQKLSANLEAPNQEGFGAKAFNVAVKGNQNVCSGDSGGPTYALDGDFIYYLGPTSGTRRPSCIERPLTRSGFFGGTFLAAKGSLFIEAQVRVIQAKAEAELKAMQEAEAKAAAEQKAKREADAKAAAEQKAKREADAKAAAEQKAKREADAKAAAEQKAKQVADAKAVAELRAKKEAEAKAAAELRAKQEAEAKAAADKAAEEKVISDAKAEAGRIFMLTKAAAKKTTISCVKGKLTKKVTAVKPLCPSGYKKKA